MAPAKLAGDGGVRPVMPTSASRAVSSRNSEGGRPAASASSAAVTPSPSGWRYIGVSGASGGPRRQLTRWRACRRRRATRRGSPRRSRGRRPRARRSAPPARASVRSSSRASAAVRERLVHGVQRPGEQARLLARGDRERAGPAQPARAARPAPATATKASASAGSQTAVSRRGQARAGHRAAWRTNRRVIRPSDQDGPRG